MKFTWWLLQIFLLLISIFFTLFGVGLLIGAYELNNPFSFLMIFFAASFIILINLTFSVSFVIKMVRAYRRSKINGQED